MSTTPETPHVTHLIDAYLAGGLDEADRQAVDAHVAICTACTAALEAARKTDRELSELFASARPASGFEDRILSQLRPAMLRAAPRWNRQARHPLVRRIAIGVAATVILGGVGFGMQMGLQAVQQTPRADRIKSASNLHSIAQHGFIYSGEPMPQMSNGASTETEQTAQSLAGGMADPQGKLRSHDSERLGRVWQRTSGIQKEEKSPADGNGRFDVTLGAGADHGAGTSIRGTGVSGSVTLLYGDKNEPGTVPNSGSFDYTPSESNLHRKMEQPGQAQGQGAQQARGPGAQSTRGGAPANATANYWADMPRLDQVAQTAQSGKDGDKRSGALARFGGGSGGGGAPGGGPGGGYGGFGNTRGPSPYGNAPTPTVTAPDSATAGKPIGAPAAAPAVGGVAGTDGTITWNMQPQEIRGVRDQYGWQELPQNKSGSGKVTNETINSTLGYVTANPVASSTPTPRAADPAATGTTPATKAPVSELSKPTPPPVAMAGGVMDPKKAQQDSSKELAGLLDAPKVQLGTAFRPGEVFKETNGEKGKAEAGQAARSDELFLGGKKRVEKDAKDRADSPGLAGDKPTGDSSTPTAGPTGEAAPSNTPAPPAVTTAEGVTAGTPPPATPSVPSPAPQAPPEQGKPEDPGPKVTPKHVDQPERQPAEPVKRMVIRNGTLQFEVDSFDSALMQMNKIVGEEGGYLSGTSSDKLPNGKVRGVVTLRCPPDRLDTLVLKLRGMGDLKSQRISAEDVTKHFTDLDSQYRAAKAMEKRLLAIIEAGGLVKDLLEAEKQLGVWREKIEVLEGEMRYIRDQVAWSTLTVELMERDVRTPTAASEQETVNTSLETEDVENSRAEVLKVIDGVKGRVIDSDLKKFEGGQLSATIIADVAPDSAGPVIDRLRQLGKVARLDISRKTTTQGGTGPIIPGLKVERKETRLQISIYNLANIAPRQSTTLNLAAPDVEATYKSILEQVKSTGGRVVSSQLNRPKADQTVGTIVFESPTEKAEVLLGAVRANVEVMRMEVQQNADAQNTTEAKRGFSVQIYSLAHVPARETTTLQLAAPNVSQSFNKVLEAAKGGGGRIVTSQLNEQDPNNISGNLEFEVLREKWQPVADALQQAGIVVTRNVARSPDTESTVDSKIRLTVTLIDEIRLSPRETISARVASATVADTFATLVSAAKEAGARVVGSNLNLNDRANPSGTLNFAIPRENAAKFETALKAAGVMVSRTVNRQADGPMNVDTKVGFDVAVFDELQLTPRETVTAVVATRQVPEIFNNLANAARDAGARVVGSNIDLSRVRPSGDLSFSVPKENAPRFEDAMKAAGLVINRTVTRQQDGPMVADGRTGFSIAVRDERTMQPREMHSLSVVTRSVNDRYRDVLETLRNFDADVLQSVMRQQGNDQRVGELTFVIRREDRDRLEKVLSTNADVFGHTVERSPDTQNTVDHRLLYQVKLLDADQQKPRQTFDISAEVTDLEKAASEVDVIAASVGGRSGASKRFNQQGRGDVVDVTIDVPTAKTGEVLNNLRGLGKVTITNQTRDDSVTEGSLSRARLQIQFHLPTAVGAERGMGESLRLGLNSGLNLVSAAAGYLVTGLIGLVVVLVFLMILWSIFRVARWMRRSGEKDQTPPGDGGTGTPMTPAPATV